MKEWYNTHWVDNLKKLKDGPVSMQSFATHDEEVSEVNFWKFVRSSMAAQGIFLYMNGMNMEI